MSASSSHKEATAHLASPSVRLLVNEAAASAELFNMLAGAPVPFDDQVRDQMRSFHDGLSGVAKYYRAQETTSGTPEVAQPAVRLMQK